MEQFGSNPKNPYPIAEHHRVCFIKNFVKSPNIIIGDYTCYDDPVNPEDFEKT